MGVFPSHNESRYSFQISSLNKFAFNCFPNEYPLSFPDVIIEIASKIVLLPESFSPTKILRSC